ncbi:hypothetical protein VTL71DRAFT_4501 [Oculimacula yallundae]|uniref:Uncharacterized protein n=1 Tax=Oculimacula yallundae TaxID=86028 RepID=A0ABR4C3A5_9HELO
MSDKNNFLETVLNYKDKNMDASQNGTGSSAITKSQNTNDEKSVDGISAIENLQCPQVDDHDFGEFCKTCRTILMPWYDKLPQPNDINGKPYQKAPRGSIVKGVPVQHSEAIAVMTLVATLDVTNQTYDEVEGLVEIMTYYTKSVAAGLRIAELHRMISKIAATKHNIPTIARLVESALEDPALTPEAYITNVKLQIEHYNRLRNASGESKAIASSSPSKGSTALVPSKDVVKVISSRGLSKGSFHLSLYKDVLSVDKMPGVDSSKRQDVPGSFTHAPPKEKGPVEFVPGSMVSNGSPFPSPSKGVFSNDEMPDVDNSKRQNVQGSFTHAPPKDKGPWEFVPGSIISEAVVGKPEPHKFFIVRQAVGDPSVKDIRQFPSWETMDWNEPEDINTFNKWQTQVKSRMSDEPGQLPKSWTKAEKEVLKAAIEAELAKGLNRSQMPWDDIAETLYNHFKDKTQLAGSVLAQPTELLPNNRIALASQRPKTLKEVRIGAVERTGMAVKAQASKYGDIALLLRLSKPYKVRGVRDGDTHDSTAEVGNGESQDNGAKKGRKRRRIESQELTSNKSPPQTPPTSAQQFKMQVAKNINPWYKSKTKSPAPHPGQDSDFL